MKAILGTPASLYDSRYLKINERNAPALSITRDGSGTITSWVIAGVTYTPTYSGTLMTSYTDGVTTWTISRDANNRITGVTT